MRFLTAVVAFSLLALVSTVIWLQSSRSSGHLDVASNSVRETAVVPDGDDRVAKNNPRDWPQLHGADSSSTDASFRGPVDWDTDRNLRWQLQLPGRGASSPIVAGNRVFVTAYSGYGISATETDAASLRHHVLCIHRDSGQVVWQRVLSGSAGQQKLNPELLAHGFASSTPATDGGHVFAFFGLSGVVALDMEGRLCWQTDVGVASNHFGSSASLVLYQDLLLVNASIESGRIYALDKRSGAAVWKIDHVDRSWSTPVVAETDTGDELIVVEEDWVRGFNPRSGSELWRCEGIHDYVVSLPRVLDGVAFVSGGREKRTMAIRLGGRGDVTGTHKLWERPIGANVPSILVHGDELYSISDNGILQCVDRMTGDVIYRKRTPTSKRVLSSPMIVGEKLLIPTQDVGVIVADLGREFSFQGKNQIESDTAPLVASLAACDDQLFVRTDSFLYCIGNTDRPVTIASADHPIDESQIIPAIERYDVSVETNRARPYVAFLSDDLDHVTRLILMPYKSVITDQQRQSSRPIVSESMTHYHALKQQREQAIWSFMTQRLNREQLNRQLADIESRTLARNNLVRIQIKKLFTPEQLERHLVEARQRQASKAKNQKQ